MANQTASREDVSKVKDLFGLAHDLIAQAQFPGHVAGKVQEVLQFLAYQFNDFKGREAALALAEKVVEPVIASTPADVPSTGIPGEASAA